MQQRQLRAKWRTKLSPSFWITLYLHQKIVFSQSHFVPEGRQNVIAYKDSLVRSPDGKWRERITLSSQEGIWRGRAIGSIVLVLYCQPCRRIASIIEIFSGIARSGRLFHLNRWRIDSNFNLFLPSRDGPVIQWRAARIVSLCREYRMVLVLGLVMRVRRLCPAFDNLLRIFMIDLH